MAQTSDDLKKRTTDLKDPDNVVREVIYDEKHDTYEIGTQLRGRKKTGDNRQQTATQADAKRDSTVRGTTGFKAATMGPTLSSISSYVSTPTLMSLKEYQDWSMKRSLYSYYRSRNAQLYATAGKNKFDFTDMHFNLGPAEKIFGPGGIQIKTQGSAELKMGINMKSVDNPAISANRRNTTALDFDNKINFTMTGKVGDKLEMNLNYNTDATFDADAQNLKLKYEGKEDEIIKLLEGGNVSFPSNNSLIPGLSSLFGIRADLQFGKLKLQTVISQKKSASTSVSSKGGASTNTFEISAADYEANRHFYLSHYMRVNYDQFMKTLPTVRSGITISKVEIWVTNKTGATQNTRNIIAIADLGETDNVRHREWQTKTGNLPTDNSNNMAYEQLRTDDEIRDITTATNALNNKYGLQPGVEYEKLQSARLLSASEYSLNPSLGTISLNTTLQSDEILAIAFEYTVNGQTRKVGEFASDVTENSKSLIVKLIKSTANSPQSAVWRLMMKNVYSLGATTIQQEKFRLDIKYQSDAQGAYVSYIPEEQTKSVPLLRALGLDRLDKNLKHQPDGQFDFVDGFTIKKGRIYFTVEEPFGQYLEDWMHQQGAGGKAPNYAYHELYDTTQIVAKQKAEHNKYILTGRYMGSAAGEIDLGVMNVAPGSVVVTAGGVTLVENEDYTVDYNMGRVTIINQSILDAGTNVSASVESNDTYGMQRKTVLGLNMDYEVNKNLTIGATMQYLSEQPLTTKVTLGSEPLKNLLWGGHISWKHDAQWLTNLINKVPFIHATAPSHISFDGEVAQLVAMESNATQGNASYIDDFDQAKRKTSLIEPTYWQLSSVPTRFPESKLTKDWHYGENRATLAWYCIDPLFTRRGSTLAPSYISNSADSLSNHYVREIYERELYPNKTQTSTSSATTLPVMNLAYYPTNRGAYNLTREVNENGSLTNPEKRWGGMMRSLSNTDFETQNVEYIEFWLMDPFYYMRDEAGNVSDEVGGDLYIDLGDISEDILKDGQKYYESGMPVDGNPVYYDSTYWGRVPNTNSVTYAFNTSSGARDRQDIGLNGLNDLEERGHNLYAEMLKDLQGKLNADAYTKLFEDPASDNYHYYRGSDYDAGLVGILDRYRKVNLPQGNSADSENSGEAYETAWKTTPDVEDINQDYTLNESEKYAEYHISIRDSRLGIDRDNFITDVRQSTQVLRNGNVETINWYQFRIPLKSGMVTDDSHTPLTDFSSVRFMRMYLTGFPQPIILRFGTLDLVHGDWRQYEQQLYTDTVSSNSGVMTVYSVNIEENNDKTPVNYVLPPGISRVTDPSQSELVEENEQSLAMTVTNLAPGDARAIYKGCKYDMRKYKHLQMFVHANALENNVSNLQDGEITVFIRLGSDYQSNYYEYEVPLNLTPGWQETKGSKYNTYSASDCMLVWPAENMIDFDLSKLTALKKERNKMKSMGMASFNHRFEGYDQDRPANRMSIMGNPTLGEVKTIMIGIRNNGHTVKDAEVWVNELRLQEVSNHGGWAARGALNIQLSDIGSFSANGKIVTAGFGSLEQTVEQRADENTYEYQFTTSLDMGRLLPEKVKLTLPFYYSYGKNIVKPKYNPLDSDMELADAMEALQSEHEKDSLADLTTRKEITRNLSISGAKFNFKNKKHPMPWDPANFTFSYAQSSTERYGETTVYEYDRSWKGSINYSWSPNWKPWEPFKKIKSKSKWAQILKDQNLAFAPQSLTASTDMSRTYYELQERDLDNVDQPQSIPVTYTSTFLWNRGFSLKWDIFKALHFSFQSSTRAEIEQPNVPVNKDLYPDEYQAWKDSIWNSIAHFGRPLDYSQQVQMSYKLPINKIPIFDWVTADGSYTSNYTWKRGTEDAEGNSLGHNLNQQRTININGKLNMETLYNHSDFLKEVNKRFSASNQKNKANQKKQEKKRQDDEKKKQKIQEEQARQKAEEESKQTGIPVDSILRRDALKNKQKTPAPKDNKSSKKGYAQEIQLIADSSITVAHNQKSKRLMVKALDEKGKEVKVKYKKIDDNKISIRTASGDSSKVRLNVIAKPKLEEEKWYNWAQMGARLLMSLRNVNISYRNNYNLSLPGFQKEVGAIFGQKHTSDGFAPGVGFGFGFISDSYIDEAMEHGWLLRDSAVSTPATSSTTEDIQVKMSVEPFSDLKIDMNMSRTRNDAKSIYYMYNNVPPKLSGSFNMTTITIATAFASSGNADNGYKSSVFDRFMENIGIMQQRVQSKYIGTSYPQGTGMSGRYDPAKTPVNPYSADVMIPAFLAAYQGRSAANSPLDIFPALMKMLPNWNITYKGLSNLPWVRDNFKSVTLTHGYKSIYSVGAYNSFTNYVSSIGGGNEMGYVYNSASDMFNAGSNYDISTVSINEAFSPLIGLNMTFNNNMTLKCEYRTTRVATLSMTSAQINETGSKDFVIGWGWKINDFKFSSLFGSRASKKAAKANRNNKKSVNNNNQRNNTESSSTVKNSSRRANFAHDLNLRFDLSLRNQDAIRRDIQSGLSEATSGQFAVKTSARIDYTMSRYVTLSIYYDRQSSKPLLSSSSYPTVTQDFGFTMKFSLTR